MALNDLPKHIRESLFEISVKTSAGKLMDPLDLFNRLRSNEITNESFKSLVVSQYEIAVRQRNYKWVEKAKNLIEIFRHYLSVWANRTLITPESKKQGTQNISGTYHSPRSREANSETLDMVENRGNKTTDYFDDDYGPEDDHGLQEDYKHQADNRKEGRDYYSDEEYDMNYQSRSQFDNYTQRELSFMDTYETSDSYDQLDGSLFNPGISSQQGIQNQSINDDFLISQGRSREWTSRNSPLQDQFQQRQGVQWGQGTGFVHENVHNNVRLSNTGMSNSSPYIINNSSIMNNRNPVSDDNQSPISKNISSMVTKNSTNYDLGFTNRHGVSRGNQGLQNNLDYEVNKGYISHELMVGQTESNQYRHKNTNNNPYGYREFEGRDQGNGVIEETEFDRYVNENDQYGYEEFERRDQVNRLFDKKETNKYRHENINDKQYGYRELETGDQGRRPTTGKFVGQKSAHVSMDEDFGPIGKRMRYNQALDNIEDNNDFKTPGTSRELNRYQDTGNDLNDGLGDQGPRGIAEDDLYDHFYRGDDREVSRDKGNSKRQVAKPKKSPERRRSGRIVLGTCKESLRRSPLQQPNPSDDDFYIDWLEIGDKMAEDFKQRSRTRSDVDDEMGKTSTWKGRREDQREFRMEGLSDIHARNTLKEPLSMGFVQTQNKTRQNVQFDGSTIGMRDEMLDVQANQQGSIITQQDQMNRNRDVLGVSSSQPRMMQFPLMMPGMVVQGFQPMALPGNQLPLQSGLQPLNKPFQSDMIAQQGFQLLSPNLQAGFQHMSEPLNPEPNKIPNNRVSAQSGFQLMNVPFNDEQGNQNIRETIGYSRDFIRIPPVKNDRKRKSTEKSPMRGEPHRSDKNYSRERKVKESYEKQIRGSKRSGSSSRGELSSQRGIERTSRGNEKLQVGNTTTRGKRKRHLNENIKSTNKKSRDSPKLMGQFDVIERGKLQAVDAKTVSNSSNREQRNKIIKTSDVQNKNITQRSEGYQYIDNKNDTANKNKVLQQKDHKVSLQKPNNTKSKFTGIISKRSKRRIRRQKRLQRELQLGQQKNSSQIVSSTNKMVISQMHPTLAHLNTKGLSYTAPNKFPTIAPKGTSANTPLQFSSADHKISSTNATKGTSGTATKGTAATAPKGHSASGSKETTLTIPKGPTSFAQKTENRPTLKAASPTDTGRKPQERSIQTVLPQEPSKSNQNPNMGKEKQNVTTEINPVPGQVKKVKRKKHSTCSVCGEFVPIPRMHFMKLHLPKLFVNFQSVIPDKVDKNTAIVLIQSLEYLKILIYGKKGSLSELIGEINAKKWVNYSEKYVHSKYNLPMTQFCTSQKWSVPKFFSINPLNTVAGLLHWRALEACYRFLDRKKVEEFISYSNRLASMQGKPELSKLFCVPLNETANNSREDEKNLATNKTTPNSQTNKGKHNVSATQRKSSANSQSNKAKASMGSKKSQNKNQQRIVHSTGDTLKIDVLQNVNKNKKVTQTSTKKNEPNFEEKETDKANIGKLLVQVDIESASQTSGKSNTDQGNVCKRGKHIDEGVVQSLGHDEDGVNIDLDGDFIVLEEISEYNDLGDEAGDDSNSNDMSELFVVVEEVGDTDDVDKQSNKGTKKSTGAFDSENNQENEEKATNSAESTKKGVSLMKTKNPVSGSPSTVEKGKIPVNVETAKETTPRVDSSKEKDVLKGSVTIKVGDENAKAKPSENTFNSELIPSQKLNVLNIVQDSNSKLTEVQDKITGGQSNKKTDSSDKLKVLSIDVKGSNSKSTKVKAQNAESKSNEKTCYPEKNSSEKLNVLNAVVQESNSKNSEDKDQNVRANSTEKTITDSDKRGVTVANIKTEPREVTAETEKHMKENLVKVSPEKPKMTVKTPNQKAKPAKTSPRNEVGTSLRDSSSSAQDTNSNTRTDSGEMENVFNVYLDPSTYPTEIPYSKMKLSVGVNPHCASQFTEHLEQFENLIHNKSVIALGPVGLDYTEPVFTWREQEEVFKAVLDYCSVKKVLILNLQGEDGLGQSSYSKGLEIVEENCGSKQPILLRNFSGTSEDVVSWSSQFKNCYFELNPNENTMSDVLKSIPDMRIVLNMEKVKQEPGNRTDFVSDVILMSLGKDTIGTANKMLANVIANELHICVDELMTKCYENKCRLFSIAI